MYFKMAFNNVKKSFKDYTIYFLTITFAIMFICSIFAETNWLYLLFAVFFILQLDGM